MYPGKIYVLIPCSDSARRRRKLGVWTCLALCLAGWLLFGTRLAVSAEQITIFTYHLHPPFITSSEKGLSHDLASFFTRHAQGRYMFLVNAVSRPRLDRLLRREVTGLVPWVNPVWFKDEKAHKLLWSKAILMPGANAVLSRKDRPIAYDGPVSLQGMVLGGISGHVYKEIDKHIAATGTIRRVDADTYASNLRKLQRSQIDVMLVPDAAARYLVKKEHMQSEVFFSPTPHSRFDRRTLVMNGRVDLQQFVDDVLRSPGAGKEWAEILQRYR